MIGFTGEYPPGSILQLSGEEDSELLGEAEQLSQGEGVAMQVASMYSL